MATQAELVTAEEAPRESPDGGAARCRRYLGRPSNCEFWRRRRVDLDAMYDGDSNA